MSEKPSRLIVVVVAMVAGGSVWLALRGPSSSVPTSEGYRSEDQQLMDPRRQISSPPTYWNNPELSLFERIFCRGNRVSEYCPERDIHPFKEYFDYVGKPLRFSGQERSRIGDEQFEFQTRPLDEKVDLKANE